MTENLICKTRAQQAPVSTAVDNAGQDTPPDHLDLVAAPGHEDRVVDLVSTAVDTDVVLKAQQRGREADETCDRFEQPETH